MAIFGAPIAGKDDACRAALAALAMKEEIARINANTAEADRKISIGIGIATGEVMVGVFGSPWKKEYTAFGAPVNLAKRLEHSAHADQILVCGDTASRVEGFVQMERRGTEAIQGFSRSPDVYGVIGRK